MVRRIDVVRYSAEGRRRVRDTLAVEEPLEIRIAGGEAVAGRGDAGLPFSVTMRTPGHDFELVAGLLVGEGVVRRADDIVSLTYCTGPERQEYNTVEVLLSDGVSLDATVLRRYVLVSASCGVCGKASIDAVRAAGCEALSDHTVVDAEVVGGLPDRLLEDQGGFARTGGLHAAGVFDAEGAVVAVREDVGRHNAVDKVVGALLLEGGLPASGRVLVVSGRVSFEIVQKAVLAGFPVLVAVGAPSTLAVELARALGQTLIGFARGGRFNVYAHPERLR